MRIGLFAAALLAASACAASAQSMTPMRGKVFSTSDEFAVKVFPRNIYTHRISFEVRTYDENFEPIEASVWPARFTLPPGGVRPVTVLVGFDGKTERRVRVCAESVPFPNEQTSIKARICGRFLGFRSQ